MPTTPTQVIDRLKLTADALQGFNETIGGATVAHRLLTNAAKDVIGYSAVVSVAAASGGNSTTGIYHLGGITLADTNTAPLQLTSAGRLIVDGSQATQPVSGTVAVTGVATATNQTNVIGTVAAGTAAANSMLAGAVYNTAAPAPTNGQQVALQMDPNGSLLVSNGTTVSLSNVPTVQNAAYSSGNVMGGLITLTGATRAVGGGLVQSAMVVSAGGGTPTLDVIFFNANPSGSTVTDKTALAVVAADVAKIIGVAHLSDTVSLGTPQLMEALNMALPFKLPSGTSLFAAIVTRSTVTPATTTDLTLLVRVLQD